MFEVPQIVDVVDQHLCTYVWAGGCSWGGGGGKCVNGGLAGSQEVAFTRERVPSPDFDQRYQLGELFTTGATQSSRFI